MMEKELSKPRTLEDVHQEFMEEIRKSGRKVLELEPDEQELAISFPINSGRKMNTEKKKLAEICSSKTGPLQQILVTKGKIK